MRKIDCQDCKYFTRKKCTVYISDPMFGKKPFVRQMYARNYCTKQEKDCTDIKECKYMDKIMKDNLEAISALPKLDVMNIALDSYAIAPTRAYSLDAGLDLYSPVDTIIKPGDNVVIDTGVHVELPAGTVGMIKSKSGLNVNSSITTEGVIDSGYTGSIRIKLYNNSNFTGHIVRSGSKIAQLVVLPVLLPEINIVDSLPDTDRGNNGFGSTGE